MRNLVALHLGALALCSGCFTPRWHTGKQVLEHRIDQAAVFAESPDSLSVGGEIDPLAAFTDYGIKVYHATDDKGNKLDLRSFQIFWMKTTCFEIEFSAPDPSAKTVDLDVAFASRSGIQRITTALPIERRRNSDYRTQLRMWERSE